MSNSKNLDAAGGRLTPFKLTIPILLAGIGSAKFTSNTFFCRELFGTELPYHAGKSQIDAGKFSHQLVGSKLDLGIELNSLAQEKHCT